MAVTQWSCLENPTDRGAWGTPVLTVTNSPGGTEGGSKHMLKWRFIRLHYIFYT